MWWIIGIIAFIIFIGLVIFVLVCDEKSSQTNQSSSDSGSGRASEPGREENSGPDEDYDECRCSSPGAGCSWK